MSITVTPTGKLLFNMLGSIDQFETEIRKEQQMDEIKRAKYIGRKKQISDEELESLQKKEEGVLSQGPRIGIWAATHESE